MNIGKKLTISFLTLVLFIGTIGFFNIMSINNIDTNFNFSSKLINLDDKIAYTLIELLALSKSNDIEQFYNTKLKVENLQVSIDVLLKDINFSNSDKFASSEFSVEEMTKDIHTLTKTSNQVILHQQNKLILLKEFNEKSDIENTIRNNIRDIVFNINNPEITKHFANMRYYSVLSLYKQKNLETINQWINYIEILKNSLSNYNLNPDDVSNLLYNIKNYHELSLELKEFILKQQKSDEQTNSTFKNIKEFITTTESNKELMESKVKHERDNLITNTILFMAIMVSLTILISILLSIKISRSISIPISKLVYISKNITNGNLSIRSDQHSKDEFGQLSSAFNDMLNKLENNVELLKIEQKRLSSIIEGTNAGTWEWDVQTGATIFNEQWANIIGYTLSEISPVSIETWIKYTHPDDLKKSKKLIDRHFKGELDYYEIEIRMKHKKGYWVWVLDRGKVSTRTPDGIPILMSGTHQDISKRKELEEELSFKLSVIEKINFELEESNKQLYKSNNAKSEFLANVSHEIRTPLNSVIGFSEILHKKLKNPKNKNYINSINAAGKSLLSLINDILDLSKIEANMINIEKEHINLKTLINEILQIFQLKAQDKNIDLKKVYESNCPEYFILDETRIRQILLNIVGNAVKFTEKGHISILVNATSTNTKNKVNLSIIIEDSGIGISTENQNAIFESFQQISNHINKKHEGTGLGLAISKKLIEMMNGTITVDSKINIGTKFKIFFNDVELSDLSKSKQENTVPFDYTKIKFNKQKILIIDDVKSNRELLNNLLSEANLTAFEAIDGEEGILKAKKIQPDLIIMDIKLPGISGIKASKIIKEENTLSTTPIIALTAHLDYQKIDNDNLFFDFISKPLDIPILFDSLKKLFPFDEINNSKSIEKYNNNMTEILNNIPEPTKIQLFETIKPYINNYHGAINLVQARELADKINSIAKQIHNENLNKFSKQMLEDIDLFNIQELKKSYSILDNLTKLTAK